MSNSLYVVHGGMGQGKGLISVATICDYMNRGMKVCTNMDLNLEKLPLTKKALNTPIIRIADLPDKTFLEQIGSGFPDNLPPDEYAENKKGILILDEATVWLNSREFSRKGKTDLVKYMAMLRKLGWDTFITIQDYEALDSQVRRGLGQAHIKCSAFVGLPIPVIGTLFSLFWLLVSSSLKWHRASYIQGTGLNAVLLQNKFYLGKRYYNGYNTRQLYVEDSGNLGNSTMLPLSYVKRWYHENRGFVFRSYHAFFIGFLIAFLGFRYVGSGSSSEGVFKSRVPVGQVSLIDESSNYFKNLRIGFSLFSPGGKSYYKFYRDDKRVYPESDGYKVAAVDSEHAVLRRGSKNYLVTMEYSSNYKYQPTAGDKESQRD